MRFFNPRILRLITLLAAASAGTGVALAEAIDYARLGMVDATAAPFYADPSGQRDSTAAINAALLHGREHHMVTWLPAGDYVVSGTIHVSGRNMAEPDSNMNDYFSVLQGETGMDGRRTRIHLAPNAPGFDRRNPVPIVVHGYYPDGTGYNYTGHFNQIVRNLDIIIGEGNGGAVGLRLQGAEGTLVEDVTIDATHGWKGAWGLPGSGGSTHRLTVIGGEIGVDLRGYNDQGQLVGVGTQPGPTISQLRLINQTQSPLISLTRGSLTLVGVEVRSDVATHAFSIAPMGSNQPWGGSLSVVDATIELGAGTGAGEGRVLVQQRGLGAVPGRGYTLHNVYIKGAGQLDTVSGQSLAAAQWTRVREFALVVPPMNFQGNTLREVIMIDGEERPERQLFDAVVGAAPPLDFVAVHGYGQLLPQFSHDGVANILDFGADPTGVADSTEALRQAIASADDVFVPKGDFFISDTVYLGPTTRLFGIHPHYSHIRGRDLPNARFGGLSDGDDPVPMLVSPDDRDARTVISMLGVQAPRAVAQHRAVPVLTYPLKRQSGRRSMLHHSQFSPFTQVSWRLQFVMQSYFGLSHEMSPYSNGGLRFASNDSLGRLFIEQLGGSARITMPYHPDGSNLTIERADATAFRMDGLQLSKATFGDDVAIEVTITGTRMDGTIATRVVPFAAAWTDREAVLEIELGWQHLRRVEIRSPLPFGIDNVVSSEGTADFERRRPFFVPVVCGDMREGFEHFPFAVVQHPQVLITGNGGGRWYTAFNHGDIWAKPEFSFIEVRDTREPLNIYHWHLQHVHSTSQAVFRNARNVQVFGFKAEHNSRFLTVIDSDQIRLFGFGGLADAAVGDAHFRFENSTNFLHAAMAEEPHFINSPEVWSSCDNPLIVHHVNLFDGIHEVFGGQNVAMPVMTRSILYKRGNPVDPMAPDSYADWTVLMGLSGEDALPEADPGASGYANLLQYALGMEWDFWLQSPTALRVHVHEQAFAATVRLPLPRPDVRVDLLRASEPLGSADVHRQTLSTRTAVGPAASAEIFPVANPDNAFLWLEAGFIEP